MTTFNDLMDEVERGETALLVDKLVGPSGIRFVLVQRNDGGIWQVFEGCEAHAWSIPSMQRLYFNCERMVEIAGALNEERLFRHINYRLAMDETAAAIEAAQYIVSHARAS